MVRQMQSRGFIEIGSIANTFLQLYKLQARICRLWQTHSTVDFAGFIAF
jgi:hypothetical protein